jgi:hypothetical protein
LLLAAAAAEDLLPEEVEVEAFFRVQLLAFTH